MDWCIEGYEELANAIIVRAVQDYQLVLTGYENSMGRILYQKELENFFQSEWFNTLTKLDGTMIMEKIRKELRK